MTEAVEEQDLGVEWDLNQEVKIENVSVRFSLRQKKRLSKRSSLEGSLKVLGAMMASNVFYGLLEIFGDGLGLQMETTSHAILVLQSTKTPKA
jgi:hypothetical protein